MISLEEYLILSALLFCISIAGIIINRKKYSYFINGY